MLEILCQTLEKIKQEKKLIINYTNFVTMDLVANGLLAVGAAPIMSRSEDEIEELIKMAGAISINIGTLESNFINLSLKAASMALKYKKPLVLDPVGVGASKIRIDLAKKILKTGAVTVIKGNASEIAALKGEAETLGVESTIETKKALLPAKELSQKYNCTVVVTGEVDFIVKDEDNLSELSYGHFMMSKVTGTGCFLGALIATFLASSGLDSFKASFLATCFWGLIGEQAAQKSILPGSYRQDLINGLFEPDFLFFEHKIKEINFAAKLNKWGQNV